MSKYKHYFKEVSNLNHIDVYRVIKLWGIEDPCQQHALKKVLCAGSRGAKNYEKDIREAIDSLNRLLEMIREDSHAGCAETNADEKSDPIENMEVKIETDRAIGIDDESEIPYVIIGGAPCWANWASRDKDGSFYWFREKPILGPEAWFDGAFSRLIPYKIHGDIADEKFENSLRRVYRSQKEADIANRKSAG